MLVLWGRLSFWFYRVYDVVEEGGDGLGSVKDRKVKIIVCILVILFILLCDFR